MRKRSTSRSAAIETFEPLVLMSASGVDGASDEVVSAPQNDIDDTTDEAPSLLSRLRDAFSFGSTNRRRPSSGFDTVEREVQQVESRLLLTPELLPTEAIETAANTTASDDVGNRAPLFRYIELGQNGAEANGTGQVDGHDPDGDTLEYSIVGGRSAEFFDIDASTGALSFRPDPQFSNPLFDGDPIYKVVVRISDGQLHHDQEISFRENSHLIITPENLKTVGMQGLVSTADRTFRLEGPDADLFQTTFALNLRFRDRPDFENPQDSTANNDYHIVRVTDLLGRGVFHEEITVRVVDIENEGSNAPLLFGFEPDLTIRENRTLIFDQWEAFDPDGDTVEYSIAGGADGDLFEIDSSTGLLSFRNAPDFENPADANSDNNYQVTIRLSDGTLIQDYDAIVTVEDAIIIRRDQVTIAENSVGPISIPDGDEVTEIAGIDGALFETDSEGNVRFKVTPDYETPRDRDTDNHYQVSIRVLGADGENYVYNVTVEVTNVLRESNGTGPVYSDALVFSDVPETTLSTRPTFRWHDSEDVKEYEIFVGRRGESDAVFRTRGITENEIQLPEDIEPGEYTVWARVYHNDGSFSRWGKGHDVTVGGRPQVDVNGNEVSWDTVPGADRYEVWADQVDQYGNRIAAKVISHTDIATTSFTATGDYADQNLTWWVRAINDLDDSVERSAWSRAAHTQQPEFLDSPQNVIISQRDVCINLPPNSFCPTIYFFPNLTWDPVDGAEEYDIFVRQIGEDEPTTRERTSESSFTLYSGGNLNTHEVWIRALGTAVAKSRWVRVTEFLVHNNPNL